MSINPVLITQLKKKKQNKAKKPRQKLMPPTTKPSKSQEQVSPSLLEVHKKKKK